MRLLFADAQMFATVQLVEDPVRAFETIAHAVDFVNVEQRKWAVKICSKINHW